MGEESSIYSQFKEISEIKNCPLLMEIMILLLNLKLKQQKS